MMTCRPVKECVNKHIKMSPSRPYSEKEKKQPVNIDIMLLLVKDSLCQSVPDGSDGA